MIQVDVRTELRIFFFNEVILWETSDSTRTGKKDTEVSKAEEREKGAERLGIEIIAENFPSLGKEPNAYIYRGIIGHINVSTMQKTFSNTHVFKLSKVSEWKDFPGGSKQESACQGGNRNCGWCLVWKDSTCHKYYPGHHNFLILYSRAWALQQDKSPQWEVLVPQTKSSAPTSTTRESLRKARKTLVQRETKQTNK